MRVLYISAGDGKYGAPRALLSMIVSLRDTYHVEPIVLTKKNNELNKICDELGIENHSFWYRDIMAGAPYVSRAIRLLKHIVKFFLYILGTVTKYGIRFCGIDFESIDIVHTNVNRLDIGCYISNKYNIPHICHLREFGKKDYNVVPYKINYIDYMNRHTDEFVAISEAVKDEWIIKGIEKEKIQVIYDGVDSKRFFSKERNNNTVFKIVIVGHIQPNKGQLDLVKAIGALPPQIQKNVSLDIIGNSYSDYRVQIEKTIKKLNISDRVHIVGYCKDIEQKLNEYDVGVTCSKSEGFGLVTVEYMMAGLLTIASNTGANTEIIQHNINGMLYQYNDINDLSAKLSEVYQNISLRKKLSQNGKMDAFNKFEKEKNAKSIYKRYTLLKGKKNNELV